MIRPSCPTAITFNIRFSPAVIIAAAAACSAQNPIEQVVSMHTPVNIAPLLDRIAAPTLPALALGESDRGFTTPLALR